MKFKCLLVCLGLLLSTTSAMAAKLTIGGASYTAGSTVKVPITLDYVGAAANISILSLDVTYDTAKLSNPVGEIGSAAGAAGKALYSNVLSSTGTGKIRILLAGGMTVDTNNPKGGTMNDVVGGKSSVLAAGTVAYVTFTVTGGTTGSITLSNVADASDPDANSVVLTGFVNDIIPGKIGDCNASGTITSADLQFAINVVIKKAGFAYNNLCDVSPFSTTTGIVTPDGKVTASDVQTLINVLIKKPGWVLP